MASANSHRAFRRADALEVAGIAWRVAKARARLGPVTQGVTSLVVDPAGKLLLVRTRYQRAWGMSGGYLDPGESPASGIVRELAEEVGLPSDVTDVRLVQTLRTATHVNYAFAIRVDDEQAASIRPVSWEIGRIGWFTAYDLPPLRGEGRDLLLDATGLIGTDRGRWVFPSSPLPSSDGS